MKIQISTNLYPLTPEIRRVFRFLASGAANTAASYAVYIVLLQFFTYRASYSIAFITGIAIGYKLNQKVVFKAKSSISTLAIYPMIYIAQYLSGLGIAIIWVDYMNFHPALAPVVTIAITLPLTYFVNRWLFFKVNRKDSKNQSCE